MMIEPFANAPDEDRASRILRHGRAIAERVRDGRGCTDREYRLLATLYALSARPRRPTLRTLISR